MLSRLVRLNRSRRTYSANVRPTPPKKDDDFRPPWVYTFSRLLSYTMIPAAVMYSVLFYDFGDRDHVFQPARRWVAQQKIAFLTLSPEEQQLADTSRKSTDEPSI
ncbi:hypothetical protein M378DRAFT_72800 [Amanita muscaria Koide BX008]|uniref:Uncharacterized protein n=1 Tax=Amanita muscaria (strain Koide BX008) TaxID=946122 RepID=A0A0C2XEN8_AMAMK|nr:hypothetical protein M378DRAFT_72800 [Amanita muscaria Koide BX008]